MNTHWKILQNPNYLGAYSLLGVCEELTVIIDKVIKEQVIGSDGSKKQCIVAYLKDQKPMILNSTNCKIITKLFGTPFIEQWSGKKMIVYVAKIKAFGDTVEALRIKETMPELPDLNPKHKSWENAKKSVKDGSITLDQIKKKYKLTHENEKLLTE